MLKESAFSPQSVSPIQIMKLRTSCALCRTITFLLLLATMQLSKAAANITMQDQTTLLTFKSLISDPSNALSSWVVDNTTLHFCQWQGVTCGGRRHPDRVTRLRLQSLGLVAASLPPHVANLTFLTRLYLGDNNFRGNIPPELSRLARLTHLNLSYNYLHGEIPASLTSCANLQIFDLLLNKLTGKIPDDIGSLSQLRTLNLGQNDFTGNIPSSLGNATSLIYLFLHDNILQGSVPASIGKLLSLGILQLGNNKLSGNVPSSLYNLSSLQYMVLADNHLTGTLPPGMFNTLPDLQQVLLYGNQLQGHIPSSLSNATNVFEIDIKDNNISGTIPSQLGNLRSLYWINLSRNQLEAKAANDWDFLASMTNCSYLETIGLEFNSLNGNLPTSVGNLSSTLQQLSMGWNQIAGSIPDGIGNLGNLTVLSLNDNLFSGSIPHTIGKLQRLHVLALMRNRFTGQIPDTIGNLDQLNRLYLQQNSLNGSIPASLGKCQNLQELDLSENRFMGAIPKELVMLSSLSTYLDLSHNLLTGLLPLEVGKLTNINTLNISDNQLFGEIPTTLSNCRSLEYLFMQNNLFNGTIPYSMSQLKGLRELDISQNNLSGGIPEYLGNMDGLQYLNMSYNNLEGEVPDKGIFVNNRSQISVFGNENLCGGSRKLHLPACFTQHPDKHHRSLVLKVIIPILGACLFLFLILAIFVAHQRLKNQRNKTPFTPLIEGQFKQVSYIELLKATDEFSQANLIGAGSVGSVYKGVLNLNKSTTVAVKVLNLQQLGASKSFVSECDVLRSIRHRNLVKILTSCSSIDRNGNDFKALVLEFMPNGSLDNWLHPVISEHSELKTLSLCERLNIAIDVAYALEYLHHHGHIPIVHCDLKPSNILLDADMCACVGDFGIARFIQESIHKPDQTTSTGIKGTIGYVAPEYGMGSQPSRYGDVYSYGILLLELFTGKRPTDEMFKDGLSLHSYVEMAFPERIMDIVDSGLHLCENVQETRDKAQNENDSKMAEYRCLVSVIGVGLSCSKQDPRKRGKMEDVTKELYTLRDVLLSFKVKNENQPVM